MAALDGTSDTADPSVLVFAQYARAGDNDPQALAAVMRRARVEYTDAELANVTVPTLIVIGEDDFAGPGEPLAAKLPNATVKTLRRTDHFATPESFGFIDAALGFIEAVPS